MAFKAHIHKRCGSGDFAIFSKQPPIDRNKYLLFAHLSKHHFTLAKFFPAKTSETALVLALDISWPTWIGHLGCLGQPTHLASKMSELIAPSGNTKGGSITVLLTLLFDWFGINCLTTDNFCFYLQNRLIQTNKTGGQQYCDTSPFSIPWPQSMQCYII